MQVWQNFTITTDANCGCCGGNVAGCFLTMPTILADGTTTPYADLAEATYKIGAQAANGCYAEGLDPSMFGTSLVRDAFDSSFGSGSLTVQDNCSSSGLDDCGDVCTSRVFLTAADGVNVAYNLTAAWPGGAAGNGYTVQIFEDDSTTIVDQVSQTVATNATGSNTFSGTLSPNIPSDGYYWIYAALFMASDASGTRNTNIGLSVTGGSSINACPVRAAYGNTPDYLICV